MNQNPEQKARDKIDQMLQEAAWVIQDFNRFNPLAGLGVAVREFPTETGPVDYLLFVDKAPVGVIEAKRAKEGERLTVVEEQSVRYATSQLKLRVEKERLPFVYESTGVLTTFRDLRDPKARTRNVFSFFRPETLQGWLKEPKSLRARLLDIPGLDPEALRDCQINAINNLEVSFKENRPRSLIQMATG